MTVLPPIAGFPEADGAIFAMTFHQGILYVSGLFTTIGGQPRNGFAAVDVASRTVTAFDPNLSLGADSIAALMVHKNILYIGSQNTMIFPGAVLRSFAAAVDLNGNLLPWDPQPDAGVLSLSAGPNIIAGPGPFPDLIYMAGYFSAVGAFSRGNAAAVDENGVLDAFNPEANDTIQSIVVLGAMIHIGGNFTKVRNATADRNHAAAFSVGPTGHFGTLTSWDPNLNFNVQKILLSGPKAFLAGDFSTVNGGAVTQPHLVAVTRSDFTPNGGTPTGTVIPLPFYSPTFADNSVGDLGFYKGNLAFSGIFSNAGGQVLENWGLMDTSFTMTDITILLTYGFIGSYVPKMAFSVALQEMYVGGDFTGPKSRLAAFSMVTPPIPPPLPTPIPLKPKPDFYLRKDNQTVLKWKQVFMAEDLSRITISGYRIYRSSNENLETYELVKELTTRDIQGVIDTMFTEFIQGFYAYRVTAFLDDAESEPLEVKAVNSPFGSDFI